MHLVGILKKSVDLLVGAVAENFSCLLLVHGFTSERSGFLSVTEVIKTFYWVPLNFGVTKLLGAPLISHRYQSSLIHVLVGNKFINASESLGRR